jgi:hypothetical protein
MKKLFRSSDNDHAKYDGEVEIVRPLTAKEADISDVGLMFKCRARNGDTFDAFADELT